MMTKEKEGESLHFQVIWRLQPRCSRSIHTPRQVIGFSGGCVLIDQILNHFARVVHFVQIVLEHGLFTELVEESFSFAQFVVLLQRPCEQLKHQTNWNKRWNEDYQMASSDGVTVEMLVWLASISPDTRCDVVTYGDFRERATWMDAGPHGMNCASLRSRIRCRLLWIWVGSTSPCKRTR